MVKVTDLSSGWSLWGDPATGLPWLKHRNGRWRKPAELAYAPEVRELFRGIKHSLDMMDMEWKTPGQELRWKAADLAKFGLEYTLKAVGRWSPDLLRTPLDLKEAR